jgi:hypothetical protein
LKTYTSRTWLALATAAWMLAAAGGCGQVLGVEIFSEAIDAGMESGRVDSAMPARDATSHVGPKGDATSGEASRPFDDATSLHDTGHSIDSGHPMESGQSRDAAVCPADASFVNDENNCGACGHDCLGGNCADGQCQPVALASGLDWPVSVTLDDAAVFWVEQGIDGGPGAVGQVSKVGGTPIIRSASAYAWGIATEGTTLFWTIQHGFNGLYSEPIDGGLASTVSSSENGASQLAIDPVAGTLFWIDAYYAHSALAVRTYSLDTRQLNTMTVDTTGQDGYYVTFDERYVYFSGSSSENTVKRVSRDGGCADASNCGVRLVPGGGGSVGPIAVDDTTLYWAQGGAVQLVNKLDGGNVQTLVSFEGSVGAGLYPLVDGNDLYVTVGSKGAVLRVPKAGGAEVTLAESQLWPTAICSDSTAIYWIDTGTRTADGGRTFTPGDGMLMKLAK